MISGFTLLTAFMASPICCTDSVFLTAYPLDLCISTSLVRLLIAFFIPSMSKFPFGSRSTWAYVTPYSASDPLDSRMPMISSSVSYGFPAMARISSPGRRLPNMAVQSAWVPHTICVLTRASSVWNTSAYILSRASLPSSV